ncbi:GNAT family N-acetyltransferase [Tenuibacillus multivorans]|uniref:GNAT family N-acetyltransferase n=1 Tax=Tenuibacillus multivorans TaxID=237069 RepID=UPI000B88D180|nr:GNAT family N-acetyltransferase [Tenuibacillus multivorans]
MVGFTYGYTSLPQQFYRQKIEQQLSVDERNTWLGHCFEFVELAVDSSYKRQGIGGQLHNELLSNLTHQTSILTTHIDNLPAINLYKQKGWDMIKTNAPIITADHLQVIMGKRLN